MRVLFFFVFFSSISCPIQNQAEAHYKGHKHARKLKALDNMKNKQRNHGAAGREREKERERVKEREREKETEEVKTETPKPLMDATVVERTGE